MTSKVLLPNHFIEILTALPEQGMGYQLVTVSLKDGKILKNRRVVNSSYLLLLANEKITTSDIVDIKLSENKTGKY